MRPTGAIAVGSLVLVCARAAWAQDESGQDAADDAVTVEVRGELLPRAEDSTKASTVIEGDDLDRPGASTADVLTSSPGTQVARTGGSAELATVTLRGATSAQTPVYLGPVALNDELTGTADLSMVPTFLLRRIEVHRGHAPLDLEHGGLSGAVVLVPHVASGTRAGAAAGGGSWDTAFASLGASLQGKGAAASAALRIDHTAGTFEFEDDRGTTFDETDDVVVTRRNADSLSGDLWTAARIDLDDRGSVDLWVRLFSREQGVPGLGVVPALHARAHTQQALAVAGADVACNEQGPDRCRVETVAWGRVSSYILDDPAGELLFVRGRQATDATNVGARVALSVTPLPELTVKAATTFTMAHVRVDPLGPAETSATRASVRAFAGLVARPTSWLDAVVEGAVRSDALASSTSRDSAITPEARAGVTVRPIEQLEVFGTAGRYARVPTLGEQFGVTATVLGNPALLPESGWSGDVGARTSISPHRSVDLAAEAVFFARAASDLIVYQRSSFGVMKPFNVASARFLGVEGSVLARLFDFVEAGSSVTFTDGRDVSEGRTIENDRLPLQAELEVSPTLGLVARDLVRIIRWDAARLLARFQYRSRRTADPAGLIELPSQALLDLEASAGFASGALEVTARLANVLDDHTTDLVGYPLPGRAFYAAVSAWWK
ncbi:MAG: TonB-dependent receptor [Polyangiaceae bacterium]|nr:TonB-dependent receptor [Polyangiaceae bacterium]